MRRVNVLVAAGAMVVGLLGLGAAAAFAASAGGYNPNQQDCQWNADAQDAGTAPHNKSAGPAAEKGCHNVELNVESGGQTNGDPNSGNTRYLEYGNNQSPNNSNGQGESYESFGFAFYIGDPGSARSPHSGCLAANTDGTGGRTGKGCGTNWRGTGVVWNYDYYSVYCPVAAAALKATGGSSDPTGTIAKINQDTNPGGFLPGNVQVPILYVCQTGYRPVAAPTVTTGTQQQLTNVITHGLIVYMGADDNLDNGEHDGYTGIDGTCYDQYPNRYSKTQTYKCHSGGASNGPSDGGALLLSVEPQWLQAPAAPTQTHPEGLANFSGGFCADSYCAEGTTQQQTVYYGCYNPNNPNTASWTNNGVDGATNPQNNKNDVRCAKGTPQTSNVYENDAPTQQSGWPDDCGSDSIGPQDPGTNGHGANGGGEANCAYGSPNKGRANTAQQVNAEPGVQIYHDPDGQGAGANEGSGINLPSAYAGTCGVYINNGGGAHNYDQYNNSAFNSLLAMLPLASNGPGGYIVNGNMVPGSQCGQY